LEDTENKGDKGDNIGSIFTPHLPIAPNPHSLSVMGAPSSPLPPNPTKWGPLAPHLPTS